MALQLNIIPAHSAYITDEKGNILGSGSLEACKAMIEGKLPEYLQSCAEHRKEHGYGISSQRYRDFLAKETAALAVQSPEPSKPVVRIRTRPVPVQPGASA